MNRRRAGFTLVEVSIAMAVLAIALFATISMITYTSRVNAASREQSVAMRAAERKIEQMLSCSNFDDIFAQYSQQVEGLGWEQGWENDSTGIPRALLNPLPLQPSQLTMPTGFQYPTPDPKAVLFVRFPLDPSTPANLAIQNISETNVGTFMDLMSSPAPTPVFIPDMDLNSNGTKTDMFTNNPAAVAPMKPMTALNLLPVWIEVHWKGAQGPSHLVYKYTFFRKN
jgi:prepilin-type N-terminal cleavage/methylation domain-containing protein